MRMGLVRWRLLAAGLALMTAVAEASPQDESRQLKAAFDRAFTPLPVDSMFADPQKERGRWSWSPMGAADADEVRSRWQALKLQREKIRELRRDRAVVAQRLCAWKDARAVP